MKTFSYQEDYDEYIQNTPLEARFDPATLQMLVVEAIPKHAAYEMMFDEYLKERNRFAEYDESKTKRLSFYIPVFPAMRSMDFAYEYKISLHKFLVNIVELGLITFMYDYHDEMETIKRGRASLGPSLSSQSSKIHYLQIGKQKITLGSGCSARTDASKHFAPSVQIWMYNALTDAAATLNMSCTDLAYLCWCIAVKKTINNNIVDKFVDSDISDILTYFNVELEIYTRRIKDTISEFNGSD